jgi:hypothetical protein
MTPTTGLAPALPSLNSVPPTNYYNYDPYVQLILRWRLQVGALPKIGAITTREDIPALTYRPAIYRKIFSNLKQR